MIGYIFWVILAMLKFEFSLVTATLAHSPELVISSIIGGILGIILFTQIGYDIERWLIKRFPNYFKKFSWKNRHLVRIRRKWGIWGIAFLSPILLGLPLGVTLSLTLTTDKMKIIKPMIISVIGWSLIFLAIVLIK
jgi:hypothetical protein